MHVLFHSSWYPNRLQPTLGNFVQRHAECVATMHDVTVLHTVADPGTPSVQLVEQQRGRLREIIAYHPPGHVGALTRIKVLRSLLGALPTVDVIHGHVLNPAATSMLWLRRTLDAPLVVTEHWTGYHQRFGLPVNWALRAVMRRAAARASVICPVSDDLGRAMRRHGLQGHYRTVPNVVDTELFRPATTPTNGGPFRLLHVSTLHDPQKNISGLIRAFASALTREPRLRLVLAGDGDHAPYLPLVRSLGLDGTAIRFPGAFAPAGIADLMRDADAFVLPSRYENSPVVILEAMASGLPVLATRVGGIAEQITEGRGQLIAPDDHDALVQGMLTLARGGTPFDAAEVRAHALRTFSIPVVAAKYEACYRFAMEG